MKLKRGVCCRGVRPELLLALTVADGVWNDNGRELVVTSIVDGEHSLTSLHYDGAAADLRTRYFSAGQAQDVAEQLREALGEGKDYDVVVEASHIHIEWQPKREAQAR